MKKITVLATIVLISAACAKKNDDPAPAAKAPTTAPTPTPTPTPETGKPEESAGKGKAPAGPVKPEDKDKTGKTGDQTESEKFKRDIDKRKKSNKDRNSKNNKDSDAQKNRDKKSGDEKSETGEASAEKDSQDSEDSADAQNTLPESSFESMPSDIKNHLKQKLDAISDAGQRERNEKSAQSIISVEVFGNDMTREILVGVSLRKGKPVLLGGVRINGRAELRQVNGKDFAEVHKGAEVKGELLCLDFSTANRCTTSVVHLRSGTEKLNSEVYVLVRKDQTNLRLGDSIHEELNASAQKLVQLFNNTEGLVAARMSVGNRGTDVCRAGEGNVVRSTLTESYEVVNGSTNFKISMLTCDHEAIVLNSPSIAEGALEKIKDAPIQFQLEREPGLRNMLNIVRIQAVDGEIRQNPLTVNERTSKARFNLQQSIQTAKLTEYDAATGRYSVRLDVKSRRGKTPAVLLDFSRRTREIMTPKQLDPYL